MRPGKEFTMLLRNENIDFLRGMMSPRRNSGGLAGVIDDILTETVKGIKQDSRKREGKMDPHELKIYALDCLYRRLKKKIK